MSESRKSDTMFFYVDPLKEVSKEFLGDPKYAFMRHYLKQLLSKGLPNRDKFKRKTYAAVIMDSQTATAAVKNLVLRDNITSPRFIAVGVVRCSREERFEKKEGRIKSRGKAMSSNPLAVLPLEDGQNPAEVFVNYVKSLDS